MVVLYFLKNYRNLYSILIWLTDSLYLLFPHKLCQKLPVQYQYFLGFQLIASMMVTSNLRFFLQCQIDQMVNLNEPELFDRLKLYNLNIFLSKSFGCFVECIVALCSLNSIYKTSGFRCWDKIESFIGRVRDSNPNCHSYARWSLPRFSIVLTSFQRKICPFYWQFQMASWSYKANKSSFWPFTRSCCSQFW